MTERQCSQCSLYCLLMPRTLGGRIGFSMETEQIIKLMKAVSENGLTEFSFKEGNCSIKIKKEDQKGPKVQYVIDGPRPPHGGPDMPPPPPHGGPGMPPPPPHGGPGMPPPPHCGRGMPPAGQEGQPPFDPGTGPGAPQAAPVQEPSAPPQTAGREAASAAASIDGNTVVCPLVGTFYSAASADDEPFVQVGDTVKKGQVLCIVEAMKLMNEIESEYDGVVKAILAKNGDLVEYGQGLFVIG